MTMRTKPINMHRHWPASARKCICGDVFASEKQHLEHQRVFMGGKFAHGPAWRAFPQKRGHQLPVKMATIAPGHRLAFWKGLTLLPQMNKVVCSCGWARYTTTDFPGPLGRDHTRQLVKDIVFGKA